MSCLLSPFADQFPRPSKICKVHLRRSNFHPPTLSAARSLEKNKFKPVKYAFNFKPIQDVHSLAGETRRVARPSLSVSDAIQQTYRSLPFHMNSNRYFFRIFF
ncbi:hypothetical protein AAHE18_07G058900 [Arachis hypogaea]